MLERMQGSAANSGRRHLPHFAALEFPNQSIIQFVTICVRGRRPLLAKQDVSDLLQRVWRKADHWLVGRYVIMPDHIHFFCAPARFPHTPLKRWVSYWSSEATRYWPCVEEKPIWQQDFFDRQLRNGESYSQKWSYVLENPVRVGLVQRAEDWPYQGEMNLLRWHDAAKD